KKNVLILLVMAISVIAVLFYAYRRVSTPEDSWDAIVSAYKHGDLHAADHYETGTGRRVVDWLFAQPWINETLKPRIVGKSQQGNRYEIAMEFAEPDGRERVRMIFFKEGGTWKFHDIWLDNLKGDNYQMFLSECIMNPKMAALKFAIKNKGKPFG